jgi:predicted exporter
VNNKALRLPLGIWLIIVITCAVLATRAHYTSDLSAFLPSAPSEQQKVLVDQLRNGWTSRILLAGIDRCNDNASTSLSRQLAQQLRGGTLFTLVENGEPATRETQAAEQAFLFHNRYLLTPNDAHDHYNAENLHNAIKENIWKLASPAGLLTKTWFQHDPGGEVLRLLNELDNSRLPHTHGGVWFSEQAQRANLMIQTRADGYNIDGQAQALAFIRSAYGKLTGNNECRLLLTGPPVFAVEARASIRHEAIRLSTLSGIMVLVLLLSVYRSPAAVFLGLLPIVTGVLAGIAAVSSCFGAIHGITLGFGSTLIGEAVDYSIYLFLQTEADNRKSPSSWTVRFWPTVRLGVMTSVIGFVSLLFSGFPGLAQLGLYSISGLLSAAIVTRYILYPLKDNGTIRIRPVPGCLLRFISRAITSLAAGKHHQRRATAIVAVCALVAGAVLFTHHQNLWSHSLSALSPISQADLDLDESMRADIGAPDVRYLVIANAEDEQGALRAAERAATLLLPLIQTEVISGFDSPARWLPSVATQQARQASLPNADELNKNLKQALSGLPVKSETLAPFIEDIAQAHLAHPITRQDLNGTRFALEADALLLQRQHGWSALLPLKAASSGAHSQKIDADRVKSALAQDGSALFFADLMQESDTLYSDYLSEAILLSCGGLLTITLMLAFHLKSWGRLMGVMLPLLAAVMVVIAGLSLLGTPLGILHLVGMLLIVAVGSNYALFFDHAHEQALDTATVASLVFANLATVMGFGFLAFSSVPVLAALGVTVAPGAILALIFSAIMAPTEKRV